MKDEIPPSAFILPPFHFVWLALDEADNDPARFLRYVVAALQSALPEVGREAAALLELGAASARVCSKFGKSGKIRSGGVLCVFKPGCPK